MPKWEKFLEEEDEIPLFEKFDKTIKNGRRLLKKGEDELLRKQKEQIKKERDEKRASKRGDEV